jgi:hypothetical protein
MLIHCLVTPLSMKAALQVRASLLLAGLLSFLTFPLTGLPRLEARTLLQLVAVIACYRDWWKDVVLIRMEDLHADGGIEPLDKRAFYRQVTLNLLCHPAQAVIIKGIVARGNEDLISALL